MQSADATGRPAGAGDQAVMRCTSANNNKWTAHHMLIARIRKRSS